MMAIQLKTHMLKMLVFAVNHVSNCEICVIFKFYDHELKNKDVWKGNKSLEKFVHIAVVLRHDPSPFHYHAIVYYYSHMLIMCHQFKWWEDIGAAGISEASLNCKCKC